MLKSSVLGSLAFVPFVLVGCGSDSSPGDAGAGAGGAHSGGANMGGGFHLGGSSSGNAGATSGKAGDNSSAGNGMGGENDMAGAAGETAASGGPGAGAGGSSAGHGGFGGSAGTAGGSAGASAGHAGTAGSSGSSGTSGSSGAAGSGGAAGGSGGSGGTSGGSGGTSGGSGGAAGGHAGAGGGTACTTSTQCAGSQVCIANLCTACDSVALSSGNTVYFVDPANGSDSNGTGSGKSGGQVANACAFKTITRALQVIGSPTQATGAIVKVRGNVGTATGETFPISVPQYVVIQGATGPVTVTLSAGKVGFNFAGTGSILKDLVLEGGGTSDIGVRLQTADAATLDAVTVQNTGGTGVDVLAGTLTLLAGTTVQMSGTTQSRQEGITVEGTGRLVAKIATGKVSVLKNTAQGIHVLGRGSVDLEGVVTSNSTAIPTTYSGTIVISQNNGADIELNQTGATTPTLNTVKGVLATGSVTSDGLLILGGTVASVRKSVFVGNALSGIHLSHTGTKANGINDVTAVDLGKATDPGLNVVQGANDQLNNKGAGICINVDPAQAQVVSAQGNVFATTDCSTAATLTKNLGSCGPVTTKPGDIGWEWVSNTNTSLVTVDAAKCN